MKMAQVRKLRPHDEVTWNDPDNGVCSRTDKILEIRINGDIVTIMWMDGAVLECFARELS